MMFPRELNRAPLQVNAAWCSGRPSYASRLMETTTSARPRKRSLFRRASSSDTPRPAIGLRHAKNASAPSLDPSPAPNHPNTSTDSLLSVNGTRANIIPDALESLPSWYNKEIDVPSSIHLIRARYPIHNPAGPRIYRNIHLRPPELLPPMEAFTSTVPSAAASASQAGPSSSSRTTSTSPAPTPASSSSRLVDPSIKPRTRKLSNNVAHDNVDLLDVTDPLGNNWHHTSPYDALAAPSPVSPDPPDRGPRSRLPSAASRPKTSAPSPLSQSTSAVHLAQEPEVRPKQKRRRTFRGVFSTRDDIDVHPQPSSSEPSTPFERGASPYLAVPPAGHKHKSSRVPRGLKSVSTTSIPHIANSLFGGSDKDKGAKREKRGSMLNKLARGFSVLRRPTHSRGSSDATGMSISDRMSMGTDPSRLSSVPPASGRHLSPEKGEVRRRVPVPTVEPSTATSLSAEPDPPPPPQRASNTQYSEYVYDDDGRSSLSVEAPYSGGRLTIVNPDIPKPDEVDDSPVSTLMPLRATSPARHPAEQVHVQAEIAGMARIQSIKRSSVEAPSAPHHSTGHSHSNSHSVRPPSQQSSHSRSTSSRLSSQHGARQITNAHASHHARLDKELPAPASSPPPFITTEISTSPITLSRPLSVLSPPPPIAPELKPSNSRDSHRSTRKPASSPAPAPAPSQPSIPMSPPSQAVPTPASSTDTVTPAASMTSPPPITATPISPFRRDRGLSQPVMSSPFIPFPSETGTPLSRASMLVNPPTPTAGPVPIPPVARMPSVFARRAKEKGQDAPSGPRSRGGSASPTKHDEEKEREAKEKEEREHRERERRAEKERLERERAELDRRVREKERELERERERALEKERLERERIEVERRVREKEREIEMERERERERERKKAEEKERERLVRERERAAEKERLEHERIELERRLWERAERERLERERQQREQLERERAEKERLDRERRREEERVEKEHRREEERRKEDERRREEKDRERWERDDRDRRDRERSRERRKERERSRERRKEKEREREDRERSRERRDREKEKERQRALEREMHREEREREKERERARSRSPFARRAVTANGTAGSAKVRETETFRLVRTLSGGNGLSSTTIVAEGQHYELVGDTPKRSKTASKEDPSRKGSRREKDKEREHRSEDSPAKPISPFSAHARSASSPVTVTRKESARRKPNDLPRLRERQPSVSSTSNRPTSDLPSAADLNAVRAREAWEMNRLWRGHSAVYDPSLMYAQSIAAASTSTVQAGGMPMSPPVSGVYDSPYMHGNLAAFTGHTPNYVFPSGLRSYPDLSSIPSIASPEPDALELRSPMRNPLPSPPKPSAFRLPPRVELKDHGLTVASS
ncbi:hypothetical protein PENSPDRAFT_732063 [Peniophora sp. CONT]|nr:hypothetical protein PENSPDRAFT_732063 [Peniophora sp. CONT]